MKEFDINVDVKTESIGILNEAIENIMRDEGASEAKIISIDVAIDEIFSNIIFYSGLKEDDKALIRVTVEDDDEKKIMLEFIDTGKPFNPLERPEPDVTKPAEEREIGGLGIFMVKKSMDHVSYRNEDGKNIFTIMKKI
ncbi:MAG: ATP-binding protein [Lachnospiraceae bacterium]|nr:ATP-binding protein [Lachnospiraceae bacterium]